MLLIQLLLLSVVPGPKNTAAPRGHNVKSPETVESELGKILLTGCRLSDWGGLQILKGYYQPHPMEPQQQLTTSWGIKG